jgi:hypothetical protein
MAERLLPRLDLAFTAFFKRCQEGAKPGFPAKGASLRLCFLVGSLVIKDGAIRIVGVPGAIKVRWHRHLPSQQRRGFGRRLGLALSLYGGRRWGLSASGAADSFPTTVIAEPNARRIAEPNPRRGSPVGRRFVPFDHARPPDVGARFASGTYLAEAHGFFCRLLQGNQSLFRTPSLARSFFFSSPLPLVEKTILYCAGSRQLIAR